MTEGDIMEGKEHSGAVREVRDNHGILRMYALDQSYTLHGTWRVRTWDASVLMKDDKIGYVVRSTCVRELLHNIVSAVYPM